MKSLATVLIAASFLLGGPAVAQQSPWVQRELPQSPVESCYVVRSAGPGASLFVGRTLLSSEIVLLVMLQGWELEAGEVVPIKVGFDNYSYSFDARQGHASNVVELLFEAENGDGLGDVLGWTERLTLGVAGTTFTVAPWKQIRLSSRSTTVLNGTLPAGTETWSFHSPPPRLQGMTSDKCLSSSQPHRRRSSPAS
jgi:hypothetical protein